MNGVASLHLLGFSPTLALTFLFIFPGLMSRKNNDDDDDEEDYGTSLK